MIARIWRGVVAADDGSAYAAYMRQTGVAGYAQTPGNRGVWMLRRPVATGEEFVMFTLWDSIDAVKGSPARTTRPPCSMRRTTAS
jgi:heme-degrading monooxygenase HmoA